MRERGLYQPIASYLEQDCDCDSKFTWMAGCGRDLAFPAGFGKRKPDVVALHQDGVNQWEVHLAEAKLLRVPTHGFDETVNQLDSLRPYADRLWAVFPEDTWKSASGNHKRWKGQLREKDIGLLLVDDDQVVRCEINAGVNRGLDATEKRRLLDGLLGPSDSPVSVPSLGTAMGAVAARAVARVAELMSGPVMEILDPKGRQRKFHSVEIYNADLDFAIVGRFEDGNLIVEGDPFGVYLRDGRPVIWVWRSLGALQSIAEAERSGETYYYCNREDERFECRPLSEFDVKRLRACGLTEDLCLGRPIPVDGRSKAAVKNDLAAFCAWVRGRSRRR